GRLRRRLSAHVAGFDRHRLGPDHRADGARSRSTGVRVAARHLPDPRPGGRTHGGGWRAVGQRRATGRPVPAAGNGAQSLRSRTPLPPGFATIWMAVAIDLVGFGIVLPILPLYAKRFHTSSFEATLLVAVFSAASLVCSPVWGRISDRFGRKPVLLVSLAGAAVGSLITGLAGGLGPALGGRIFVGAAGGGGFCGPWGGAERRGPAERAPP